MHGSVLGAARSARLSSKSLSLAACSGVSAAGPRVPGIEARRCCRPLMRPSPIRALLYTSMWITLVDTCGGESLSFVCGRAQMSSPSMLVLVQFHGLWCLTFPWVSVRRSAGLGLGQGHTTIHPFHHHPDLTPSPTTGIGLGGFLRLRRGPRGKRGRPPPPG